jgi:hypothetical protein
VNVHGQAQFGAFGEDRVHPRIVDVHAGRIGGGPEAASLVTEFTDAGRAGFVAALQFRDGVGAKPGLSKPA